MMLATLIHARASSSEIIVYSNTPQPRPPNASSTMIPKYPRVPIASTRLRGISRLCGS